MFIFANSIQNNGNITRKAILNINVNIASNITKHMVLEKIFLLNNTMLKNTMT